MKLVCPCCNQSYDISDSEIQKIAASVLGNMGRGKTSERKKESSAENLKKARLMRPRKNPPKAPAWEGMTPEQIKDARRENGKKGGRPRKKPEGAE